jgi:hypothetical protein
MFKCASSVLGAVRALAVDIRLERGAVHEQRRDPDAIHMRVAGPKYTSTDSARRPRFHKLTDTYDQLESYVVDIGRILDQLSAD